MTLEADQIVDRRRLRRKLSFWRVVGFAALAVALLAVMGLVAGVGAFGGRGGPQIARLSITGFITEDRDQIALIKALTEADSVKGVIVAIDSGGGASVGGEALYDALRKLAAAKPTVATMGTVGASAAYLAALATDHIVAHRTTITASIGVIFQYPEIGDLLRKLGIDFEEIKSGPLKSEPSLFEPASEEARRMIAALVQDSFNYFVDIVAERRNLPRDTALALADGRIVSGGQALDLKLIDAIGGEDVALAWLGGKGVDVDLPIVDWKPRRDGGWFSIPGFAAWIAGQLGLAPAVPLLDDILPERLKLDGLLSVWHGSTSAIRGEGAAQ